ncbi:MAG: fibronectin type III domain-containing protein, partial [Acidimicrobiia bacterium]|nr:fibronectin type III domain-containing protein [Acidimicrobiia bacterium]
WYGDTQNFGALGNAQTWVNVLGNVSDPDGLSSLSFQLNGGASQPLSIGSNQRRLYFDGDFNVEIDISNLVNGPNTILIEAVDLLSNVTQKTVTLNYTQGTVWPGSFTADWSAVTKIEDAAQVVDGEWELTPGGLHTVGVGYDRTVGIGDYLWDDFEVLVPFTLHDIDETAYQSSISGAPTIAFTLRWQGHTELNAGEQPHQWWVPHGAGPFYDYIHERYSLSSDNGQNDRQSAPPPTLEQLYYWKARVESLPTGETAYDFKWWEDGQAEPTNWILGITEPVGDLPTGSLLLVAHHVDVTFGDVAIQDLATETDPPLIINPFVTAIGDTSAEIHWETNEHSTSQVAHGETAGYELGVVGSPSTYSRTHVVPLTGLTPGTGYHYQIQTADQRGNVATTVDAQFSTTGTGPPPPSSVVSDDFSQGTLSPIWTYVDPLADSTQAMTGLQLSLSPGTGNTHDIWTSNTAPHILQTIPDEDFEIEAKFESDLTANFQSQGILVQQDSDDLLRVEFHRTGSPKLFVAKIVGGSPTTITSSGIPTGTAPLWLRVRRIGNDWTVLYSTDGTNFIQGSTFTHAMTVSGVGVFAGNSAGTAHTALVDYFFNNASPIVPEDGGGGYVLTLGTQGNGSVSADPSQASYAPGTNVDLTATPDPGWVFDEWQGDVAGNQNPVQVTMNDDVNATAVFVPDGNDTTPPVISNVQVVVGSGSATVTWDTDELADSLVEYGTAMGGPYPSSESDATLVTQHSVLLTGLVPDTQYFFQVSSADASLNSATDGEYSFTTDPPPPPGAGIVSDEFEGVALDTNVWTFVDPFSDSSVAVGGGNVTISIPDTSPNVHDIWTNGAEVPRIMQDIADADFEAIAKFVSDIPAQGEFLSYGILIEETVNDVVRVEFLQTGSALKVFVAEIFGGSANVITNTAVAVGLPRHLRVNRSGDQFTVDYSQDGSAWTTAASFTQVMTVDRIGVYAGSGANVDHDAQIDSFLPEPRGPASLAAGALLLLALARIGRRRA